MKTIITDTLTNELVLAKITPVKEIKGFPLKKNGWNFNWSDLYRNNKKASEFFKLSMEMKAEQVEGMLMLSFLYDEMVFMNNIEVSPHNIGKDGRYDNVAGSLIAFACCYSFVAGKGTYNGFLSFESKTKLIPLYQKKYGATLALGNKMFIEPEVGKQHIKNYLGIEYKI